MLNQIITKELQYIISQNNSMRGPTNYYRTWDIRFNEEKGLKRRLGKFIASPSLSLFRRRWSSGDLQAGNTSSLPPRS